MGLPLGNLHKMVGTKLVDWLVETWNGFGYDVKAWLEGPTTFEHCFDQCLPDKAKFAFHVLALNENMEAFRPSLWELPTDSKATLEQCWFPGDHMDVGGGDKGTLKDPQIMDITLAYMMSRLEDNKILHFRPDYLAQEVAENKAKMKAPKSRWGLGEPSS